MKAEKRLKSKHLLPLDALNWGINPRLNFPVDCDIVRAIANPFKSIDFLRDLPRSRKTLIGMKIEVYCNNRLGGFRRGIVMAWQSFWS